MVSLYEHLARLLNQVYPESYTEHRDTLRSLASMLAQKTYDKLKNNLDPLNGLPHAIQVWFPAWYPKTRVGIQFTDSKTIGIYVQQSLEPNGDFNSQIRFAQLKIPPALSMTALTLGWAGFLINIIEHAKQEERELILQDEEKADKLLKEQGDRSLLSST